VTRGSSHQKPSLTALPAWQALATHFTKVRDVHLRSLFASDPSRGQRFSVEAAGLERQQDRVVGAQQPDLRRLASGDREHDLRSGLESLGQQGYGRLKRRHMRRP